MARSRRSVPRRRTCCWCRSGLDATPPNLMNLHRLVQIFHQAGPERAPGHAGRGHPPDADAGGSARGRRNLSSSLCVRRKGRLRAPGFDPAPFSSTTTCRLAFRRRWPAARAVPAAAAARRAGRPGAGPSISTPTRRWRRSSPAARHGPVAHQPSVQRAAAGGPGRRARGRDLAAAADALLAKIRAQVQE